jgi:hypothetical protein
MYAFAGPDNVQCLLATLKRLYNEVSSAAVQVWLDSVFLGQVEAISTPIPAATLETNKL